MRELDALMGQEISGSKLLIPIWLNLTHKDVLLASPLLADRVAINAAHGFDHVLSELKAQIDAMDKCTDRELDDVVARFFDSSSDNQRFLQRKCLSHFSKIVSYYNAYEQRMDEVVLECEQEDEDEAVDGCDRLMKPWLENGKRNAEAVWRPG